MSFILKVMTNIEVPVIFYILSCPSLSGGFTLIQIIASQKNLDTVNSKKALGTLFGDCFLSQVWNLENWGFRIF